MENNGLNNRIHKPGHTPDYKLKAIRIIAIVVVFLVLAGFFVKIVFL